MPQIIGRELIWAAFNESTFGVVPGAPAGERMYLRNNSVGGTIAKLIDDTLSGFRGQQAPVDGAIDLMGAVQTYLAPQSCGRLLNHAIGLSATTYAVARKTTALITGVEVLRAESGTTAGNGTLAFTAAGTTITWAESGGTAGAAVNIGAGGDFTITSTGGYDIFIRVTASLLPVGNQNDTVAVSAGTVYEHVFTPGGVRPAGLLMEGNLGSSINAARRYVRLLGLVAAKAQFEFPANGFASANYDFKGATFNLNSGAALDGTLDDYGHAAFSMRNAGITLNGAAFAQGTTASLSLDNDIDDSNYTIGGNGARASIPVGQFLVSGSLNALYDDTTAILLNDSIAGTPASIAITLAAGTGAGTAGNEALIFRLPDLSLTPVTPKMEGPKGIRQTIEFNGFRPTAAESRVEICLRTTRAANTF